MAIERFCNEISSITTLQTMIKWEDRKSSSTANNFMTGIEKRHFIVGLAIVKHISSILRPDGSSKYDRIGEKYSKMLGKLHFVKFML